MVVYGQGRYDCAEHGPIDPLPRSRADLDAGVFEHRCPICGATVSWQLVDEEAPLRPRSLYAASKTAQEHYAAVARWVSGTLRPLRPADTRGATRRGRRACRPCQGWLLRDGNVVAGSSLAEAAVGR